MCGELALFSKPLSYRVVVCLRDDAVKVLSDALATVAKPSKGGIVRDALISSYPRLAHSLESMFERLNTETTMKVRLM